MPKARILAVDDQRYFRELIEGLLVEEGYEAQTAASGEEAMCILDHSVYDIILTDLVMPGMDGGDLVHRVKERWPDQDIVVVTGVIDVKTAVEAMRLGASDYLLKPFDRATLSASLEAILQRKRLRAEHARLLAENIEYLGERSLYERALELFSCLSLEALIERVVEGLCLETGAQGGVIWVPDETDPSRLRLAAARGLVRIDREPAELDPGLLPEAVRDESARSALGADGRGGEDSALYLGLRRDERWIGVVRLTDKLGGEGFDEVDRCFAEKFARFAEQALANALRFRHQERGSLEDPITGAYRFEYFADTARNEIEKASRFGRRFSLLRLALGTRGIMNRAAGDEGLAERLRGVVANLRQLLRATDLLAADRGESLYVLLPEADSLGAAVLKRRARDALIGLDGSVEGTPLLSAVTYPCDGTQLESLLRGLERRLDDERRSPVEAMGLEDRTLGESLRALLALGEPARPETAPQIARFVLRELQRRPRERGLVFVAPGSVLAPAVRDALDGLGDLLPLTEIALVTDAEDPTFDRAGLTRVPSRRSPDLPPFLVTFGDGPAYALVCEEKPESGGARLFHTSDRVVVEHLAFRLQRELGVPHAIPLRVGEEEA